MSNIRKETIDSFTDVHPKVLKEGIKVACKLLSLQGVKVTDYIFDWDGCQIKEFKGMEIICGLDAQNATSSREFPGMGLVVNHKGKFVIIGDFYYSWQKNRKKELEKMLTRVLGGACYFAARAMIASAKGQNTRIKIDDRTKQLQLVVQM